MVKRLWRKLRQQDRIAALEHERDYLDARLAQFELLAEEFVQFQLPDHMCRMRFLQLLNCGKVEDE